MALFAFENWGSNVKLVVELMMALSVICLTFLYHIIQSTVNEHKSYVVHSCH